MLGHPSFWGGLGVPCADSNHRRTEGWKSWRTAASLMEVHTRWAPENQQRQAPGVPNRGVGTIFGWLPGPSRTFRDSPGRGSFWQKFPQQWPLRERIEVVMPSFSRRSGRFTMSKTRKRILFSSIGAVALVGGAFLL